MASDREVLHVLPPYGAPGVCPDYDADCLDMNDRQHTLCFAWGNYCEPGPGVCPFLD